MRDVGEELATDALALLQRTDLLLGPGQPKLGLRSRCLFSVEPDQLLVSLGQLMGESLGAQLLTAAP